MGKYACSICGYIYDESKGNPAAGIAPGTAWEELPEGWACALCGASKTEFTKQDAPAAPAAPAPAPEKPAPAIGSAADMKELSALELSALCTNLARGCEKQYKPEAAALFTELAGYFKSVAAPAVNPGFDQLTALIEKDLGESFSHAGAVARGDADRGALRALVWSEKVTRMIKSLLARYQQKGDAMLRNTGVYVCTICGFIYIGDKLPDICPVCKVPNWKFEKVEGRE